MAAGGATNEVEEAVKLDFLVFHHFDWRGKKKN